MPRPVKTVAKPAEIVEVTEVEVTEAPAPKTKTDWNVLYASKLTPISIECREYQPVHYHVVACHSRLPIAAASMKSHLDADHGGCFFVDLVAKENPWKGWKELEAMGIELADFRCNVCLKEVPMTPGGLAKHMKPHLNGNRRVEKGGMFRIQLTMNPNEIGIFDEEE